jgi:uncharacterized protein
MKESIEKRLLVQDEVQFRAVSEGDKRYLEGYAAVYNSRSKLILERGEVFYEELRSGAFDKVLQDETLDVYLTLNHQRDKIMARTVNGSLELSSDEIGLKFRAEIPDRVSYANDVYELVKRGDLYQNSFAFVTLEENTEWSMTEEDIPLRGIKVIDRLVDISVVTIPAYNQTSVQARDLPESTQEPVDITERERMKLKIKL